MRSILIAVALGISGIAMAQPIPLIPELTPVPPPLANPPVGAVATPPAPEGKVIVTVGPKRDWLGSLGSLERASVKRALAARGLEIEPDPAGRVIDKVHVVNEDVFAEKNRVLQFFNHFHITTREATIAKELVIGEGEVWDQDRVDETARRLRDPLWTSVVAVLPVRSRNPERVDMLVVTRDVWSLRLNTKYTIYKDPSITKLTYFSASLSENNFLGRRSVLAYAFQLDQNNVATGPVFIDKNLFGQHLTLSARVDALFNRDRLTGDGKLVREGSDSSITLSKPLWSLGTKWAAGVAFSHAFQIERSYRGTAVRTYDNPDTSEVEAFPFEYDSRAVSSSAFATRKWGKRWKHQASIGYGLGTFSVAPYRFAGDDVAKAAFVRDVLPRSETSSGPYVEYAGFEPRYIPLRNVGTYDFTEDLRLGYHYSVLVGAGAKLLGATYDHWRVSASAGYTLRWCRDGYLRASGSVALRHQTGILDDHAFIDNTGSARLRVVTPSISLGRIVWDTSLTTRWIDTQNRFYGIGGDGSLRGFGANEFVGDRALNSQIEARSKPIAIWVFRVGGVVFYEMGGAANSLAGMQIHQNAGIGLRTLIPQTSRELFRFDLAFPFDGINQGRPVFIAGFESAF